MDNLIDYIEELITTDEEDRQEQGELLQKYYASADKTSRKWLNLCFTCLCGYTLETIILKYEQEQINEVTK